MIASYDSAISELPPAIHRTPFQAIAESAPPKIAVPDVDSVHVIPSGEYPIFPPTATKSEPFQAIPFTPIEKRVDPEED